MQTYDLLKFALARSNGSSFLLITQYEMPFINKIEATGRSKDRKINGKCANGTNYRSRVWPVYIIYITTQLVKLRGHPVHELNSLWQFLAPV